MKQCAVCGVTSQQIFRFPGLKGLEGNKAIIKAPEAIPNAHEPCFRAVEQYLLQIGKKNERASCSNPYNPSEATADD